MERDTDASLTATETADPRIEETSAIYLARWNHLVSTTNWEKGRIISQWRAALIAAAAPPREYSDEAWCRRLQSATPQHIGRLRRVWERFGDRHTDFDGLFWSHFQAALDWSDAEMWLEGALQNDWSVSMMRAERANALAATGQDVPIEVDDACAGLDNVSGDVADSMSSSVEDEPRVSGDDPLRPSAGRMDDLEDEAAAIAPEDQEAPCELDKRPDAATEPVRPFAELAELPDDLAEAFDAFKLAILRHKLAGWKEIGREEVLGALHALEALALAPSA